MSDKDRLSADGQRRDVRLSLTRTLKAGKNARRRNRSAASMQTQLRSMASQGHMFPPPTENTRPFHVEEPEKLSAPMGLLLRRYYDAGRNPDELEGVLDALGEVERGVAGDLRQRILEDLAEIRGTPWLPEPRKRVDGSAYGNFR